MRIFRPWGSKNTVQSQLQSGRCQDSNWVFSGSSPLLLPWPMKDTRCGILYLQVLGTQMSTAPCVSETSQPETHTDGERQLVTQLYWVYMRHSLRTAHRFCWGWSGAGQPRFYREGEKSPLSWVFHVDKAQEGIWDGGEIYTKFYLKQWHRRCVLGLQNEIQDT